MNAMKKTERVAYHEAGHVVCAVACGHEAVSATIIPDGDSLGSYCIRFHRQSFGTIHHRLLVHLAGPLASAMHQHGPDHKFEDMVPCSRKNGDWRQAVDAAVLLHPRGHDADPREIVGIIRAAGLEAQAILARPLIWRGVERVAAALLQRKKLTGQVIQALIVAPVIRAPRDA